jgi:hypothetical protein
MAARHVKCDELLPVVGELIITEHDALLLREVNPKFTCFTNSTKVQILT